ncbi:NAD(P)/FAD-dependent oxidoreductase [Microaerobacter geothermalis]|uniref:NAD(P)/FAD-dependent oxidoreductase n=1 Tax=Microaerobacter geothermalis TaxID=674972 RepID=UPI001F2CA454|nr:NAD(P)/FAD-dependent oxidoreductase [Microaerobacter geothermalis]MCF6092461.1 NAD(P)/FAD-dependent oxidoreductase [Microaerobacter geothermalis]
MMVPKILILGAGYGGLMTMVHLQRELSYNEAEITLVNKHDYHYITTHLHEPAAGTAHHERIKIDIKELIDEKKVNFIEGIVKEIKPDQNLVLLEDGQELSYDYLVIALGSEPETFGIKGLREHALSIRNIDSVRMIKEHIEYMFSKYNNEPDCEECLTFVVGGAGFTGIEFVGELADRIPALCEEFDVDPGKVKIINIEASPSALPGFDQELVRYAIDLLEKKGVTFLVNTAIKECTDQGVILANGDEIKAGTVIWTGGVRGNSLIETSGFETKRGRAKVDDFLRPPGHENIFIIGDCSLIFNEEGRPYPPTAQIATQQGENCGKNLTAQIRGGKLIPFIPHIRGTVASLGRGEAVGVVGKRKLFGFTAYVMKKVIDHRYLYMIGGIPLVLKKGKF